MPPVHNKAAADAATATTGASAEHQQLAHTIKHVHRTLRDNTKRLGAQRAWTQHLADTDQLRGYSAAMRSLATRFWEQNTASKAGRRTRSSNSTEHNRIAWSVRFCAEYFGAGGDSSDDPPATPPQSMLLHQRERELRIWTEAMTAEDRVSAGGGDGDDNGQPWTAPAKLRLLDVGSCYNPFAKYEQFDVTAVDIAPADGSAVRQCDFLALRIDEASAADAAAPATAAAIDRLPGASFDVIVFSLLLEYMPTSEQRLHCCRTAYQLLRPEGVLIIITPDSKHVGANARLIKTWRYALALMGLSRVRMEKLEHLTCMVFRRSLRKQVAQRWASMHREEYMAEAMHIPQDFVAVTKEEVELDETEGIN